MSNKRKHKTLTLTDKVEILKLLDNGETTFNIAQRFDIGRSTVHGIKMKRSKIIEHVKAMDSGPGKRKTLKFGACPKMETALYMWFLQERAKHTPITGDILRNKSKVFYQKITGKDDFRASDGWLHRFKLRFGIRLLSIAGEKNPSESAAVGPFVQRFKDKVEELGLLPDQLYNIDESGLFLLPNQTFVSSQEKSTPDPKIFKERIMFIPCSNATGTHKFELLVIGKAKNPSVFKNACLPVCYKNQSRNWVTSEVFGEWFREEFVPGIKKFMTLNNLPEKALLILNNVPGHPNEEHLKSNDGMIQAMFLPPNSLSLLQPMDQNVIQMIKSRCKKKLLLDVMAKGGDIKMHLKELDLKNVVFSLADSWKSVPSSVIRSSWKNLWPYMDVSSECDDDDLSVADLLETLRSFDIKDQEVSDWLTDNTEEKNQFMTDDEICEDVMIEDNSDEPPSVDTKSCNQPDSGTPNSLTIKTEVDWVIDSNDGKNQFMTDDEICKDIMMDTHLDDPFSLHIKSGNYSDSQTSSAITIKTEMSDWLIESTEERNQFITGDEVCRDVVDDSRLEIKSCNYADSMTPNSKTIKTKIALESFNTCITWAEENGIAAKDIIILRKLRRRVVKARATKKQTTIKDYFSKL